jgi:hypothetical protein
MKDKWEHNILSNVFLYFGNRLDSYYRSYTKIQQVLAEIGGFEKLIYNSFYLIYLCFSYTYRNLIIINKISFNEDHIINLKKEPSKRDNISSMIINPEEILKIEVESKLKNKNKNITFLDYICYKCGRRKFQRGYVDQTLDYYKLFENFYIKKMDILKYFKLHNEVRIFKQVFLTSEHRKILKFIYPKIKNHLKIEKSGLDKSEDPVTMVNTKNFNFSDDIAKNLYELLESKLQNQFSNLVS